MIGALHGALDRARQPSALRGVLLDAEGPHFSFGASVEEHLPAAARQMLASLHALVARDARVPGADPGRGARPVPRRRPRARAGRRPDLRRARRAARPARDEARRVRAGRLGAAAVPRQPAGRRGPAVLRPLDRRRRGAGDRPGAGASPTTPKPRRSPTSRQHLAGKSAAALRLRAVAARAADAARRAGAARRGRAALSRSPDGDARRQRGPRRLPRATQPSRPPRAPSEHRCCHSSPVPTIVERCQTLFEDLDFKAVKEWKAAMPGRKAIGYMPVYVPRELIHAAGMLPVGILGGGDSLEVIQGDAYYQSYICRIPRSTIELGLTGRLDCLDGMLFPSICDVIRNLSGMWQILFKDKYVKYIDVPQNYQRLDRRQLLHPGDADAARRPRQAARLADHRRRAERRRSRVYNDNRARGARPVQVPRRQALAGADLGGLPAAARRHGAAARGAHASGARVPRRDRRRAAAEARQRPRRAQRRRSASSRRSA